MFKKSKFVIVVLALLIVSFALNTPILAESNVIVDNAKFCNMPGGGADGADLSVLYQSSNLNILGFGCSYISPTDYYVMADKFTLDTKATITEAEFYVYQYNFSTTSTITDLYVEIYRGNPMYGGTKIWGNFTDNIIKETSFTGCYRVTELYTENRERPIMRVSANINQELEAGEYYIGFSSKGNQGSGPYGIPVVFDDYSTQGTGIQFTYTGASWINLIDESSAIQASVPFKLYGTKEGTKSKYNPPAPPSIHSKIDTRVTLVEIPGAEYKIDDGSWQDSNIFNNLLPNTTYNFYARIKETNDYFASDASAPTVVMTNKEAIISIGYHDGEDKDSVKSNINLPLTEINNIKITWSSSNEDIISNEGIVTLPKDSNKTVTLTATIDKEGLISTQTFQVTVIKEEEISTGDAQTNIGKEEPVEMLVQTGNVIDFKILIFIGLIISALGIKLGFISKN